MTLGALASQILEVEEQNFVPAMVDFVIGYRCRLSLAFRANRILAQDRCPQSSYRVFPAGPIIQMLPSFVGIEANRFACILVW
jgi:hypothetical protein